MDSIEALMAEITQIELEMKESAIRKPLKGAIRFKYICCGKPTCRCMHGGPEHGPYPHLQWWEEGKLKTKYLNKKNYPVYKKHLENTKTLAKKKRELANTKRGSFSNMEHASAGST